MKAAYDFANKVVIITGSSRGNGREIAFGFLKSGAIVYGIDCNDSDSELLSMANYNHIIFDLNEVGEINAMIRKIYKKEGKINILINNAGITCAKPISKLDITEWESVIRINLTASFFMIKACSCLMSNEEPNNSILNITSLASSLGFPNNSAYSSSKGALLMLSKTLAREFGGKIRVNALAPGYIKTDMTAQSFNDEKINKQRSASSILQRWGESSDLVGAALFLSSSDASFITGHELCIDGGWRSNGLPYWEML